MDEIVIHGPELVPLDPSCTSLTQILCKRLKSRKGTKTALIDGVTGASYTFGDIEALSAALAYSLKEIGIEADDVVSICSENRIEYIILMLSLLYIGATVAPINPMYTKDEIIHSWNISRPKLVFTSSACLKKILDVVKTQKFVKQVVTLGGKVGRTNVPVFLYSDLVKSQPRNFQPVDSPKTRAAVILSSSGTTGLPKGVKLSHGNIISYINNDGTTAAAQEDKRILGLMPFFHGYGVGLLMKLIVQGLVIISLPKFEERLFLSTVEKYKIQLLPLVPPLMIWLAKSPLTDEYDLSSVTDILCGAAPIVESVAREVLAKLNGANICHAYGMTEVTIVCTVCQPGSNKFPSVGQLIPGLSCKVVDTETGKSLGPGKPGELCFKGPQLMMGYCGDSKSSSEAIDKDGWLHSGDIGYYDEDHFFYIVDRIKELIKYKAFQVAPAELEALLLSCPGVKDAAVVGKPDPKDGEHPTAFIVKQPNTEVTAKEIMSFMEGKVSPQKKLRGGVYFVEAIPKNPSGKILRRELREKLRTKCKL